MGVAAASALDMIDHDDPAWQREAGGGGRWPHLGATRFERIDRERRHLERRHLGGQRLGETGF